MKVLLALVAKLFSDSLLRGKRVIIQCKKCGTKYNFDEALIEGEGIWVRCTRCKNMFFQVNPGIEPIVSITDIEDRNIAIGTDMKKKKPETGAYREVVPHPQSDKDTGKGDEVEQLWQDMALMEEGDFFNDQLEKDALLKDEGRPVTSNEPVIKENHSNHDEITWKKNKTGGKRKGFWTPGRVVVYPVMVIVLLLTLYFWFFPQVGRQILNNVYPVEKSTQIIGWGGNTTKPVNGGKEKISFVNIKEHTVKNWIVGDIFIIQGIAVNKNASPVSQLKVKGRIVDSSGTVLMKEKVYAGNILADEELKNLTEEEIKEELSNPWGSDFLNRDIPYKGEIPFMIVFSNPPESAKEYLIDPVKVEAVSN